MPMSFAALFGMWAVMMALMMLPGALPAILRREGWRPRAVFAAGYLAVWTAFSAVAAIVQGTLESAALLSDDMLLRSSAAAGITLIAAGIYQLTRWKHHFLLECRVRASGPCVQGVWNALPAGLRYGTQCLGSSAPLMALMLVVGVMNAAAMIALAIWILAEKSAPWGIRLSRIGAAGLLGWGGSLLAMAPA
jgi:predicted metal-binding membrane protein